MSALGSSRPPSAAPELPIGIIAEVRLYREALAERLTRDTGLALAWTAADGPTALARAAEGCAVVAVLDLAMRDSLQLARALRQTVPALVIVGCASHDADGEIIACAEAGLGGLVSCDGTLEELALAVLRAGRGEMSCSPRAAAVMTRRLATLADAGVGAADPERSLTARERAILELLDRGLSNKEIAGRLHIQVATVKNHVHNVLEKLGVGSRGEAAAKRRGSVSLPAGQGVPRADDSAPTRI